MAAKGKAGERLRPEKRELKLFGGKEGGRGDDEGGPYKDNGFTGVLKQQRMRAYRKRCLDKGKLGGMGHCDCHGTKAEVLCPLFLERPTVN